MAAELAVEENVIEMRKMNPTVALRASRGLRRALLAAATVCLLLALGAAAALADPVWSVTSVHGGEHMPPGGAGQYVIQVYNDGDLPQQAPLVMTDTLPAGVTATAVTSADNRWVCDPPGSGTVQCTRPTSPFNRLIQPPQPLAVFRGAAPAIFITVSVDPSVTGTEDNLVTVSDGLTPDASATDPTTFSDVPAGFGIAPNSFLADAFDGLGAGALPVRQAGAHPFEARVDFRLNLKYTDDPLRGGQFTEPDEELRNVTVKLPRGFIGNPTATPQCTAQQLFSPHGQFGVCPVASQVGTIAIITNNQGEVVNANFFRALPVYNMVPPHDAVAAFAFLILGQPVWIKASLDPTNHDAVITHIDFTSSLMPVRSSSLRLWGVPADPAHDPLRFNPATTTYGVSSNGPVKPFLTLPQQCGVPDTTKLSVDSWQHPGVFATAESSPVSATGCEDPRIRFTPSIHLQPTTTQADAPTGLSVDIDVPQKDDTITDLTKIGDLYATSGKDVALNTPPVRNVTVVLPDGMTVSPSSADGLAACAPAQIGLMTNDEPTCPDASKLGTVEIATPLLSDPLEGHIYLAAQNDNPFGSLLALYLVAEGPGVIVKLPGKIEPDPVTGQLTATFADNPQLPFSKLHLQFKSGPRAPLSTPPTCGVKTATATITSWNDSVAPVQSSDSFTVTADGAGTPCGAPGFHPRLDDAGTVNPLAGKDSPLVTTISRPDGDQPLGGVDLSLPGGLLGRVASLVLCPDGLANAGTCADSSKIGSTTVAAGPGANPFYITNGRVYMTGPYKGAPFGLSIVVPAKAGPFDLGTVVVRAQVQVDRRTAALRIVTDPLPTILQGIPLQLRLVNVTVDRPHFTLNPTSCASKQVTGRITSSSGSAANVSSHFQVAGCAALPFDPQMSITVGARRHTRAGVSTPLTATIRMGAGQANLRAVSVTLPTTLNALLPVLNRACSLAEFQSGHCGAGARAGSAVAVTPLLRDPLRGSAYFVRNPKRTLPDLMIALRGQVAVDLTGKVSVSRGNRLATLFDTIPDVPITKFALRLVSGGNAPVGTTTDLCSAKARAALVQLGFRAQSGKVVHRSQRLRIAGCPAPRKGA